MENKGIEKESDYTPEMDEQTDRKISTELPEAIKKLAEKKPEKLFEFMAMEMSGMGNPLQHKMNSEHISQILQLAVQHDENQFAIVKQSQENEKHEKISNRRYLFTGFIIIAVIVLIVLFLFKEQPQTLVPVLTGLGGLISGFLGGFGLGKSKINN